MLTTEIRVNGALLGHLYLVNLRVVRGSKTLYSVEYYKLGTGTFKETVLHNPDDGAEVLVVKAMNAIMKEMSQ